MRRRRSDRQLPLVAWMGFVLLIALAGGSVTAVFLIQRSDVLALAAQVQDLGGTPVVSVPPDSTPGRDGRDGTAGLQGPAGRDGADGITVVGPPGRDGSDGEDGQPGRDGVDGRDGISVAGAQGPAGADGVDGESIVGPAGPPGESIVGPQGEQGPPGFDGSPPIGWTFTVGDTSYLCNDPDGDLVYQCAAIEPEPTGDKTP